MDSYFHEKIPEATFKKIKNKHGGADAVFLFPCVLQPSGGTDFVSWYQRQKPCEA